MAGNGADKLVNSGFKKLYAHLIGKGCLKNRARLRQG